MESQNFQHGQDRTEIVSVGKYWFFRSRKFCARHGWTDLRTVGSRDAWHQLHDRCRQEQLPKQAA